jgi:hypothetical protein
MPSGEHIEIQAYYIKHVKVQCGCTILLFSVYFCISRDGSLQVNFCKIYGAQDTNGFLNGLAFCKTSRDEVGHLFYFLLLPLCEMEKLLRFCLSAKWKSF